MFNKLFSSNKIDDFFIQGGAYRQQGVPWYGKQKKKKPPEKKRSKRNKPGFLSAWHDGRA